MAYRSPKNKEAIRQYSRRLYVEDKRSLDEIREETGEAMSTLETWSDLEDWETQREASARTVLDRLEGLRDSLFDRAESQLAAGKSPHTEIGLACKLGKEIDRYQKQPETVALQVLKHFGPRIAKTSGEELHIIFDRILLEFGRSVSGRCFPRQRQAPTRVPTRVPQESAPPPQEPARPPQESAPPPQEPTPPPQKPTPRLQARLPSWQELTRRLQAPTRRYQTLQARTRRQREHAHRRRERARALQAHLPSWQELNRRLQAPLPSWQELIRRLQVPTPSWQELNRVQQARARRRRERARQLQADISSWQADLCPPNPAQAEV